MIVFRFPSDPTFFEGELIKFPPSEFWNKFVATTKAQSVHFSDYPEFDRFALPDGIHLDARDSRDFTELLSSIIFSKNYHDAHLYESCRGASAF